jgi:hypothetical protein
MKKIVCLSLLTIFTMMFCCLVSVNMADSAEKRCIGYDNAYLEQISGKIHGWYLCG